MKKLTANGDYFDGILSTARAGKEGGKDIAIDEAGNLYVVGYSGYN